MHVSEYANDAEDGEATRRRHAVSPTFEGLLEGAGNNRRSRNNTFYVSLVLFDELLRQVLCISVGVRKIADEFLLIIFDILQTHGHDLADGLLDILWIFVDGLLDLSTLPIAVNVSSRDMREDFQFFALLRQIKHSLRPKIVDIQRVLQRIIKIDRGGTIDKDIRLVHDKLVILRGDAETFDDQIALDWNNL